MQDLQQLEIVYRSPFDLVADPRNARVHSTKQLAQIQASIKQFGCTTAVALRQDGVTIGAGHGRWMAAKKLKLEKIPTVTLNLSDAQWKAYVIADNAIPLGATWDVDILKAELEELPPADLTGLGLDDLLKSLEPVEAPAPQRTGTRVNQTVIQANIVFDDEQQQGRWFGFVRELKADQELADCKTFASKLDKWLQRRTG